jgi:hypothetical protein
VEKPKIQQLLITLLPPIEAKSKLVHLHEATVWRSTTNFYASKKCLATLLAFADAVRLRP